MNRLSRGLLALAVVVILAVPAGARTRNDERDGQGKRPLIVQLLKKWVVRAFGDGLTIPRP